MSSKSSGDEGKHGGNSKYDDDDDLYVAEGKHSESIQPAVKIEVLSIELAPCGPTVISDRLDLNIKFELDRDAIAAYWRVKFLVDSSHSRVIKVRRYSYDYS